MATKPGIPKGTRDFSPVEMAKRNYIFNTIRESILFVWISADRNSFYGKPVYPDGKVW